MKTKALESKIVYEGRAFDVRQDTVELPDGRTARLDIVAHRGAVTILPVNEYGQIVFIHQFRHAAGEILLELPAGVMEAGEPPEESARREAREEIGMDAGDLRLIGEFFLAPGYSTELMHVYLARDLHPDPLQKDADEFLSLEPISIEQAYDLAQSGQIRDAKSLAALLLARPFLM
jgi:ADP-ribose pyrophosphatase